MFSLTGLSKSDVMGNKSLTRQRYCGDKPNCGKTKNLQRIIFMIFVKFSA